MTAQTARTLHGDVYRTEPRVTPRAAAPEPEPAPPRPYLPEAVDLGRGAANSVEWGTQPGRICDIVKTIDLATESLTAALVEFVGEKMEDQRRRVDELLAGVENKIAVANARSVRIELETVELRAEIADLTGRIERDRASRGVGDGASLPEALRRPVRAKTKRKRAADAMVETAAP
jgi:hypothetical protein